MKIIPLTISAELLQQMLSMKSEDMHELVETVGLSASMNENLSASEDDKIVVALSMLRHVHTMLEQCGCDIDMKINNNRIWNQPISYSTDANS